MIKNHYLKNKPYPGTTLWDKKLDLFEALIYGMLPEDELLSENQIVSIYQQQTKHNPKMSRNNMDALKSLRKLVKDGFIREVSGKAIAKIV